MEREGKGEAKEEDQDDDDDDGRRRGSARCQHTHSIGFHPLKVGRRAPPRVQTHKFVELRPAMATRSAPEGQEASLLLHPPYLPLLLIPPSSPSP